MGFTHVKVSVQNPTRREKGREVELLIDTGAVISVIPKEILKEIGIRAIGRRKFRVFGGELIEREVGVVIMEYEDTCAGVTVAFGEEGDTPILGVTALETLGYQVDPVTKKLKKVELLIV